MANPWFRLYAEFATDVKVQMMSEAHQRRLIMLMCMRCNTSETLHETKCTSNVTKCTHVSLSDDEIAFQLRISSDEWNTTKQVFISKKIIDEHNNLINWDKRQFVSDSSTKRVYEHRKRLKQQCNVTVTPPDTDTDTDTDINKLSNESLSFAQKTQDAHVQKTQDAHVQKAQRKKHKSQDLTGFDDFWRVYPKKKARDRAEAAWVKINPDERLRQRIISAVTLAMTQEPEWKKNGGEFIPYPATYLNGKRWDDVLTSELPTQETENQPSRRVW